jgi:hypothetical protein
MLRVVRALLAGLTISAALPSVATGQNWSIADALRPRASLAETRRNLLGLAGPFVCPLSAESRIVDEPQVDGHCGTATLGSSVPMLAVVGWQRYKSDSLLVSASLTLQLALQPNLLPERVWTGMLNSVAPDSMRARCEHQRECEWTTERWRVVASIGGLGPTLTLRLLPLKP